MALPPLPPSSPRDWPLWVYCFDLTALVLFAGVIVFSVVALAYVHLRRHFVFNVFGLLKAFQCTLAILWVVGLLCGELWFLDVMGDSSTDNAVCTTPMIATFGIAQPMFLLSFGFAIQLQVTDLVGRYRRDPFTAGASSAYSRMVSFRRRNSPNGNAFPIPFQAQFQICVRKSAIFWPLVTAIFCL